ncbi:hypothetical protein [Pinibacter soli]|uniref:Uncharacterized protein n=1 Tax=Pinibacter soli TaxID=3044211 RepID=A0ABT6RF78_9BACT|nr:hypothetical protein [Pinibacter soli]MDI3321178.1 hypothetical protein [Pinibacter soli]
MDSRLIYEANKKAIGKVDWVRQADSEWVYCGVKEDFKNELIASEFNEFFNEGSFYFSKTRKDSFECAKPDLMKHVEELIGVSGFCIWDKEFKKVIEFNAIGTFRKGEFSKGIISPPKDYWIKKGSPDKVRGKLVKYRKGDCVSIHCGEGKYLAVFISEKFNKYYDFTLFDYLEGRQPTTDDFINGYYFGRYGDSPENVFPCVEKIMMDCLEIDASPNVEKIVHFELTESLTMGSYIYGRSGDLASLLNDYKSDIERRRTNTENFNKHPDVFFIGDRLMKFKEIIKEEAGAK